MPAHREIRANYDRHTIVVYQAYNAEIADAAVVAQRFVPPFSTTRMTWIKPSFLWLMERSNWGRKPNQQRILAVRVSREGWDRALSLGVLTSFEPSAHRQLATWRQAFDDARVHVQWDPERSLHGKKLEHRAIQVGISRHLINEYVNEWTKEIVDLTPLVAKIRRLREQGDYARAARLLPPERAYEAQPDTAERLAMNSGR